MPDAKPWDLVVNRAAIDDFQIISKPHLDVDAIGDGQLSIEVDRCGLSANNILYAVLGERNHYWSIFPAREESSGIVPVWGFGDVVSSKHPEIKVGERLYGYFPLGTHAQLAVADLSGRRFRDPSPHRQQAAAPYHMYTRVSGISGLDGLAGDRYAVLRPLFSVSFLANAYFSAQNFFGGEAVIISSASSKTSIALAYLVHRDHPEISVVGLTSDKHRSFVEGLGYYDEVVGYDAITSLQKQRKVIFFDVAGNWEARAILHQHFADYIVHSARVGLAHWNAKPSTAALPGPAPKRFFGPDYIRLYSEEWGPAEFARRFDNSFLGFAESAKSWLEIVECRGSSRIARAYDDAVQGKISPHQGYILAMK